MRALCGALAGALLAAFVLVPVVTGVREAFADGASFGGGRGGASTSTANTWTKTQYFTPQAGTNGAVVNTVGAAPGLVAYGAGNVPGASFVAGASAAAANFQGGAGAGAINLLPAADPSSPANGDLWCTTTACKVKINNAVSTFAPGAGGVSLQPTTPGSPDTGNINVSGNVIASGGSAFLQTGPGGGLRLGTTGTAFLALAANDGVYINTGSTATALEGGGFKFSSATLPTCDAGTAGAVWHNQVARTTSYCSGQDLAWHDFIVATPVSQQGPISVSKLTVGISGTAVTSLQHKRVAGCATAAAAGAVCSTTIAWATAFADGNYTVVCAGDGATSGVPVNGGVGTHAAASATFTTAALTTAAAQYTTIDCIATHD